MTNQGIIHQVLDQYRNQAMTSDLFEEMEKELIERVRKAFSEPSFYIIENGTIEDAVKTLLIGDGKE